MAPQRIEGFAFAGNRRIIFAKKSDSRTQMMKGIPFIPFVQTGYHSVIKIPHSAAVCGTNRNEILFPGGMGDHCHHRRSTAGRDDGHLNKDSVIFHTTAVRRGQAGGVHTDHTMMRSLVPQIANTYGVFYLRMPRKKVYDLYGPNSEFQIGKAEVVRNRTDVTLIDTGMEVIHALRAADLLEEEGIFARVVDMFTIKPIDKECICRCAQETGAIVTCENESVIGGLGSAVAETLVENILVPMERIGVQDEFGEVGPQSYLEERFGLTAPFIVEKAKKAIERKANA